MWKHSHSPLTKKAETVQLAGQVTASEFWDADGITLVAVLQKGRTVTGGQCYVNFWQLRCNLIAKNRGKLSMGVGWVGGCGVGGKGCCAVPSGQRPRTHVKCHHDNHFRLQL